MIALKASSWDDCGDRRLVWPFSPRFNLLTADDKDMQSTKTAPAVLVTFITLISDDVKYITHASCCLIFLDFGVWQFHFVSAIITLAKSVEVGG